MADGNFQFLIKCKQIAQQNKLKELIIPDTQINTYSLLTQQQILTSQYSSAMIDQIINPTLFKNTYHYSIPVLFAMLDKAYKMGNLQIVDRIQASFLRDSSTNKMNKHIIMFNRVKILQQIDDIKKATFVCENLLKQAGDGSDYYTFQFLQLLDKQGRTAQAIKIAERHLEGHNSNKHKIQSSYIHMLSKSFQKDQANVLKKIETYFHNRKISVVNIYNIAILLKQKYPEKALQLFKKVISHLNGKNYSEFSKILTLTKINIISIYDEHYLPLYPHKLTKYKLKQILQECQNIYQDLEMVVQDKTMVEDRRKKNFQTYSRVLQEIRNQSNINFLYSISSKKKILGSELKFNTEQGEYDMISEANKSVKTKNGSSVESRYFQQKRAQNEKRLKFLLNKEKELKQFFNKLKVEREGSKLNIKLTDKSLMNKTSNQPFCRLSPDQLQLYETKYEDKKKQYKALYDDQINSVINNFINQWISPLQKNKVKVRNAEKMKNFVITLQCPNVQQKQNSDTQNHISRSKQKIKTCRTTTQGFRVKHNTVLNTARKGSEKMLEVLKYNDHISNQIVNNLKNNMAEKRRQDRENSMFPRKNFKGLLHEGQILQQQNKLQQAHEHYAKMYKHFKKSQQKQTLLLKIAQNFEKLDFYQEAQKTYLKCTKFNSIQAFFRLGNLQIRNGKVQVGIENLEKANCIDRHNIKIQIQLVYGYSLLEQTTERALALANSILKRNPQCLQALIMSSKILQKKGKLKEALEIALAIGNTVKTAATFHYIGLLYLNDSNVSEAYRYFHKALECEPNHIPSLIELATIISQAKPQEAIQILKKVLAIDSKNQLAFARLGKIYESFQNNYESALVIYKKGLQSTPSYENYVKIGDCYLKKGSVVDAYLNYKEALLLKATPEVYEKIAEVHELQHQDKKAVEVYALALAQLLKDGQNPNMNFIKQKKYLQKLGQLSLVNQQYEAAYGYLFEVLGMQETFDVLKMLGQACFGKGDYSEALNYYQRAAAMLPQDNLQILQHIAMCFDKQEQYLTSKQIYQKILSIDPKNIKCLNNLANILLIIGKTNEAFYWYQFMLQQSPNNLERRLRVADIYATIGDWSKVQQHLTICHKQKQNDIRVLERMVNLYKEKRDIKQLTKFEKRLGLLKSNAGKVIG